MANCRTVIKQIQRHFLKGSLVCNIEIDSEEPDNPFWGSGWGHREWDGRETVDNVQAQVQDWTLWDKGYRVISDKEYDHWSDES